MNENGPNKIPEFRKGQKLLASDLNPLVDGLGRARGVGPSKQVFNDPRIRFPQFIITEVKDKWLVCRTYSSSDGEGSDEVVGTTDILVAKPERLRPNETRIMSNGGTVSYSAYSNNSQRRTATFGTYSMTQIVVENYRVDDLLHGLPVLHTDVFDDDGKELTIVDLNVDGRAWGRPTSI